MKDKQMKRFRKKSLKVVTNIIRSKDDMGRGISNAADSSRKVFKYNTIYNNYKLSAGDIENQKYKQYFGGGKKEWERRGAFQLFLLKTMGLSPSHKLLDIGCGPLRAGTHFINYLNEGNYYGVDYSPDFLKAANYIINSHNLNSKKPRLLCIKDFQCLNIEKSFDYSIAFSVLNHCSKYQQKLFFQNVPKVLKKGAKLYITHAHWLHKDMLLNNKVSLTDRFDDSLGISQDLDMSLWGWSKEETIFPVLELTCVE